MSVNNALKFLSLKEQCTFACVDCACKALSASVTRLLTEITVPRVSILDGGLGFGSGITALAAGGRLAKLRSVTFEYLYQCENVIDAFFENCSQLVDVHVEGVVCVRMCVWVLGGKQIMGKSRGERDVTKGEKERE